MSWKQTSDVEMIDMRCCYECGRKWYRESWAPRAECPHCSGKTISRLQDCAEEAAAAHRRPARRVEAQSVEVTRRGGVTIVRKHPTSRGQEG